MKPSQQIAPILQAFTNHLKAILGDKLHGAYVYGAVVFNDDFPTGDIDFHVILVDHLTPQEKQALEAMHTDLGERFPPLGRDMDGYYILLNAARQRIPPRSELWALAIDNAFALHREHIRAGRVISLVGDDPCVIYQPATWDELETALDEEIAYVLEHLHAYPDYCILNLSRLIYSFQTRNVVISKAKASEWAMQSLPQWRNLIELARKSYQGVAKPNDHEMMLSEVGDYFAFALEQIQANR